LSRLRLLLLLCVVGVLVPAGSASAAHDEFNFKRMDMLFSQPNANNAVNSDLAFFGKRAYAGNYSGIRIFDISDPDEPELVTDFPCLGAQNDLTVWDTNRDRRADLLITSVDRTQSGPQCGATNVAHDDPNGWEGLRLFRLNGDTITQIGAVYQDCGSHTHTGYRWGNVIRIINNSYPLRPGPTCGPVRGPEAGRDPAHGVVQFVDVPMNNPAAAQEVRESEVVYQNDPANPNCMPEACEANAFYAFSEIGLAGDPHDPGSGLVEPLRACHDVTVFMPRRLVAAACSEDLQLWRIGRDGFPDTANPVWSYDQPNVDFWHSATFSWDGKVVNAIDESFGEGCPTVTQRPMATGGQLVESGNMFFLRTSDGAKLSEVRYPRPTAEEHEGVTNYCSAHLGAAVPTKGRNLLVNAWYTGGVNVIDFSDPRNPVEVAYWDWFGDNWAAYWYEYRRPEQQRGFDIYASHGVESVPHEQGGGFQKYRANLRVNRVGLSYFNPQTQEMALQGPNYGGEGNQPLKAAKRAKRSASASAAAQAVDGRSSAGIARLAPE